MGENKSGRPELDVWLDGLTHDLPDGEIAGYVALGSRSGTSASGYAIVRLPYGMGPAAVGRHMESKRPSVSERIARALDAHRKYTRDLERALGEKSDYVEELIRERERAEEHEAATALDNQAMYARLQRADDELKQWRTRASIAEGDAMRARLERDQAVERVQAGKDAVDLADTRAELADCQAKLERITKNWRESEKNSDAAWARVGELQKQLDEFRESSADATTELLRATELDNAQALEQADTEVSRMREQLRRVESQVADLDGRLSSCRAARAVLERRLAAVERERDRLEEKLARIGRSQ